MEVDCLENYCGNTDEEKTANMKKYKWIVCNIESCYVPKAHDLLGNKVTINSALAAFGISCSARASIQDFCNDAQCTAALNDLSKKYNRWCKKGLHSDTLKRFVKNDAWVKQMDNYNSFFKNCLEALREWDNCTRDVPPRDGCNLYHLHSWDNGLIYIQSRACEVEYSYDTHVQPS
jgi:hypothetical protein